MKKRLFPLFALGYQCKRKISASANIQASNSKIFRPSPETPHIGYEKGSCHFRQKRQKRAQKAIPHSKFVPKIKNMVSLPKNSIKNIENFKNKKKLKTFNANKAINPTFSPRQRHIDVKIRKCSRFIRSERCTGQSQEKQWENEGLYQKRRRNFKKKIRKYQAGGVLPGQTIIFLINFTTSL